VPTDPLPNGLIACDGGILADLGGDAPALRQGVCAEKQQHGHHSQGDRHGAAELAVQVHSDP
jgi:hypothetical protein